tara:strand:- start:41 stop:970 length:930 start_codon:yes stop_codon:yes gene_type:complete
MALPTPKRIKGLLELMDEALEMDAAKEAVSRLGLKADNTATDRAKALGFDDKTYYHGTNKDFDSFDPKIKSRVHDYSLIDGSRNATYVTDIPELANRYSMSLKNGVTETYENARILPVLKRGNLFDGKNPEHIKQINDLLKKPKWKWHNNQFIDGPWYEMERPATQQILKDAGFDGYIAKETGTLKEASKSSAIFNPANIRSQFAKFNPKYAGIGAGSIMSSNLLEAPSGQPEFREAPMSLLDKAKKYAADSYEYAANEGGPIGKFLYSGGAEALKDIEQGTTPMVKTGRLPAMPTGAALARLLELLQL